VQDQLKAQRKSGARSWRHFHHLIGSLFCAECGGRLIYNRASGHGGIYEYFVCRGKQQGRCSQPHHRAEAVEAAVERHYVTVELSATDRGRVRTAVQTYMGQLRASAGDKTSDARADLARLDSEERKLLAAHYADNISDGLFAEEAQRIRRERVAAQALVAHTTSRMRRCCTVLKPSCR
jgi:site-specific DNA recombinase